jgi:hypothetical protein
MLATKPKVEPKPEVKPEPEPPEPTPEPTPAPEPAPIVQPPPAVDPPSRSPWYLDKLGLALTATGVLGGVVGVMFYTGANSDIDAAKVAANYGESEKLVDGAADKRRFAIIAGSVGGALLVTGVVRFVMVRGRNAERALAVTPLPDGAAISWSGRW